MVFYNDPVYQREVIESWFEEGFGKLGIAVGLMIALAGGIILYDYIRERSHSTDSQENRPAAVKSYENNREVGKAKIEKLVDL